jgi:L-alanine-DL-glutamate epimerase-like enolase superfamily enzyme
MPGVQALGLALPGGALQVSTNLVDVDATPLHVLVERIVAEAAMRGASVDAGELVGLLPARCVVSAAEALGVRAGATSPGGAALPTPAQLAAAARAFRLDRLEADRVLEWHVQRVVGAP